MMGHYIYSFETVKLFFKLAFTALVIVTLVTRVRTIINLIPRNESVSTVSVIKCSEIIVNK